MLYSKNVLIELLFRSQITSTWSNAIGKFLSLSNLNPSNIWHRQPLPTPETLSSLGFYDTTSILLFSYFSGSSSSAHLRVKDFVLCHLLFTFCTPLVSDPIQTQALNIVQRLNISTIYLQPCPHPWVWTCTANSLFNTSTWMSNEPWPSAPPSSFPSQLTVPSPPDAQARTLRVILDSSLSLIQSIWSLSQTCWLYLQSISELPLLPMITICPTWSRPPSFLTRNKSLLNDTPLLFFYSLVSILWPKRKLLNVNEIMSYPPNDSLDN